MGEYAEMAIDFQDDSLEVDTRYWKTWNGRVLKLTDMEDSHLVNTLKMLRKTAHPHTAAWVVAFAQEIKRRNLP
jgi:hypothetical protein